MAHSKSLVYAFNVEQLVHSFHAKATEILERNVETSGGGYENTDNTVAKLFKEIKIMFENLPSRIEHRIDPSRRRNPRNMNPMLFEEFIHVGRMGGNWELGFLMALSLVKESLPWFYEVGVETFRAMRSTKSVIEKKKIITSFEEAVNMLGHPMIEGFFSSKETYILVDPAEK